MTGRDLLVIVNQPATLVNGQTIANVDVSPAYFDGTRVQLIAKAFEFYKFKKLRFDWKPSLASTAAGSIGLAFDHDVSDSTPPVGEIGLRQFGSYENKWDSIWSKFWLDVNTSKKHNDVLRYYCNESAVAGDPRLAYEGQLYVYAFAASAQSAGTPLGAVEVDYEIEFTGPQLENADGAVALESVSGSANMGVQTIGASSTRNAGSIDYWSAIAQASGTSQVLGKALSSLTSIYSSGAKRYFLPEGSYYYAAGMKGNTGYTTNTGFVNPVLTSATGAPMTNQSTGVAVSPFDTIAAATPPKVFNLSSGQDNTAGHSIDGSWVLQTPPGGAYLDGLFLSNTGSEGVGGFNGGAYASVFPIARKVFALLAGTSGFVFAPKPKTKTDFSSKAARALSLPLSSNADAED